MNAPNEPSVVQTIPLLLLQKKNTSISKVNFLINCYAEAALNGENTPRGKFA